MQGSDLIRVGWTLLKSEFSAKQLKMFYTEIDKAYQVYTVSPSYGLVALIVEATEVADFETNYKASSIAVESAGEAVAIVTFPKVSPSTVGSQDSGRSFGYLATSSTTEAPVMASVYTPPGNNVQRSVRSTDPNDASPSGTGAREVKITYLDASGAGPFSETVILNGTNAIDTENANIAFIEKIEVVKVGSGGSNAGTIELLTGIGGSGSVVGSINPGDNQTYWAHHYVPAKKKSSILEIEGSSSVTPGSLTLNSINPLDQTAPKISLDIPMRHGTTHIHKPCVVPISVDGPALIFLEEQADVATASITFAGFSWVQF